MGRGGWLYIMANRYRGGMYVGVTSGLPQRVWQHREGQGSEHVRDFAKTRLVYAERHEEIERAIAREKLVKKWRREWKFGKRCPEPTLRGRSRALSVRALIVEGRWFYDDAM